MWYSVFIFENTQGTSMIDFRKIVFRWVVICMVALMLAGCSGQKASGGPEESAGSTAVLNKDKMVDIIYTEITKTKDDSSFYPETKETLYLESIYTGSFTGTGKDELLAVVKVKSDRLPHAAGLYHAYMAVFNNPDGTLVSEIRHFMADEGDYMIYRGQDQSFIFFQGAVVYQGAAARDGGLFKLNQAAWEKVWPDDPLFWDDHAVDIRSTGVRVMKKRILSTGGGAVPDITWDFGYFLSWTIGTSQFERFDFEY